MTRMCCKILFFKDLARTSRYLSHCCSYFTDIASIYATVTVIFAMEGFKAGASGDACRKIINIRALVLAYSWNFKIL